MEIKKCTMCGSEKIKKGKTIGGAQSLNCRAGVGSGVFGSDLIISFCSECGEVLDMKVANPEKVK